MGARSATTAPDHGDAAVREAAGIPPDPASTIAAGGVTAMMKKLAAASAGDMDRAWRRVLIPGTVIGRFQLLREIDRGSCGVVFEARDRQLGRLVAFKAVKPGRESQVMLREELLQKEAEAAAQLNHPNIVSLYDVGTCESGPYLIMELLRGETLRDRLQRDRLPVKEALEIAIEIAWALDHAHSAGVIHRDVKPANVFLSSDGHVKVLDFGIAHVLGAGSKDAVGTPAYMAPEQWRHGHQDARTDVFGAAAMLAQMVTGRLPYEVTGDSSEVLEPGARPHVDAPGLPHQLTALLRRALSPAPERRPRDGNAWLSELLEVHEQLDRAQPAPPFTPGASALLSRQTDAERERGLDARMRRTDLVVLGAVAAAVAFGALAYFLLN
jgi:serine/threonine protein kinase